ncbi:U1 small nuclear ribonucleo A [Micractinium conductrix]|uniref:U1 small nuclear ribonucleo A n=1 Tax=Micractinium conductrix TaxID=554055 RepID=A0A2P6VI38_9CHLO|nr:U1 small nuclear ribonucleo A [Micractinium conductrix]|eukprot:PSC73755.1 U1 small nuclear ribonucleo A [Micractinium conductrix]
MAGSDPMAVDVPVQPNPGHTIYVNNLPEKVSQEELKKAMYAIFGQFGKVLDVNARRTYRLRGQAWVIFEKAEDAARAMELMQGFPFQDKPLRIALAKTKSDTIAKLDGTFRERPKVEQQKKGKAATEAVKQKTKPAPAEAAAGAPAAAAAGGASSRHNILFVENLPESANEAMVGMLFQQFAGFKEVRMVAQRPGIAFVEYSDEGQAVLALQGLQGFKLATDKPMSITFAKA